MLTSQHIRYIYLAAFMLFAPCIILAKTIENTEDPFVVILITKNAESEICQALDQYVHEGIHSFLIYDVYSTDNTVEVLKKYFLQHEIQHGHIVQGSFDNGKNTRNRTLELAEEYFPQADFFLIADVNWHLNWELHTVKELQQFCREEKNTGSNSYRILHCIRDIENYEIRAYKTLLIRARAHIRFKGSEWEYILSDAKVPSNIYFTQQLPYAFPFKDIFVRSHATNNQPHDH